MKILSLLPLLLVLAPAAMADSASPTIDHPKGLQASDWQDILSAHKLWKHRFRPAEGNWQAYNSGQRWTMTFDGRGFMVKPREAAWSWGLELCAIGRGTKLDRQIGDVDIKADGQRLGYHRREGLEEWFVNNERGLEHGFTLTNRPQGPDGDGPLCVVLSTLGTLHPLLSSDTQSVQFYDEQGATVLSYSGLEVWDADGKILNSRFRAGENGQFQIVVDEAHARYPITIDPIAQQAYIKASDPGLSDHFGQSVAIFGDTVVIGAPDEDSSSTGVNSTPNEDAMNSGAVYVFVRSGGIWAQQAYIKASNPSAADQFGNAVALSGDTLVIGAAGEDSSSSGVNSTPDEGTPNSGAAYVFVRDGTSWTQQAYLKASNPGTYDYMGNVVAISGDTIIVGAYAEDSSSTGVNSTPNDSGTQSGAAYVFVRNGSAWSQQAYLKASVVEAEDWFGYSVAVSGDTILIGSHGEDSSTTGVNTTPNNLATDSGAAYVFVRNGTTWTQQAYLKASNAGANDYFGWTVALSGDTAVVGAMFEDSSTTGVNGGSNNEAYDSGAAYVFVRSGGPNGTWTQQAFLKASNTGYADEFARAVAISGETIVIGAYGEDSASTGVNSTSNNSAQNAGAAYVFIRSGTIWAQQAYLKASNTGAGDNFGWSVGISDNTVVVAAYNEDSGTSGVNSTPNENISNSGAAYLFTGFGPGEIALDAPTGTSVSNCTGNLAFGESLTGQITDVTCTLRNVGGADLVGILPSITGPDAASFAVVLSPPSSLPGGSATDFTIRFSPMTGGQKSATLSIASSDADENPFTLILTGRGLSTADDTDGDGLNDAAEFRLSDLGYDWQSSQPALVEKLMTYANLAGLYSTSQVQALHIGTPLISRNQLTGKFILKMDWKKSADLEHFSDFPAHSPEVSVNPDGDIEFEFSSTNDAAFFKLEAK